MRNKIVAVISCIALIAFIAVCVSISGEGRMKGNTRESREAILQSQPGQHPWKILDEQAVDGHLICAMREDHEIGIQDEMIGIAIFEALDDGNHAFVTWTKRPSNDIATAHVQLDGAEYFLAFADFPALSHAEVTFSRDETLIKAETHQVYNDRVLTIPAPQDATIIEIIYFDQSGNSYE